MFGHLQLGRKAEYNPRKFADLLGLDSSEQQDPQVGWDEDSTACLGLKRGSATFES